MASRGFEFAYMLDGSNATPVIRDFTMGTALARVPGDLMLLNSSGYLVPVTGSTKEVTGVFQETMAAADITVGTTKGKLAIITHNQVWRCSMDASSTAAVVGSTKTIDTVDHNTIDADDLSNGSMVLVDTDTDDDGNVLAYVAFTDTTFGNA